jgi:hypothetical protein
MGQQEVVSGADPPLHLVRSEIDTPLKVFSIFGVISGVLLLSTTAYAAFTLSLRPVDYSSPVTVASLSLTGIIVGFFAIFGGLLVHFARMSIERRGVLAFFVFIASVLSIIGSLVLLNALGP